MANIKQKIIRIKTNEKARLRNSKVKSRVRTFIRKTKLAIINHDEDVINIINTTNKEIDKSVSKSVFKLGKAARIKSRIMALYNKNNKGNPITAKDVEKKVTVKKVAPKAEKKVTVKKVVKAAPKTTAKVAVKKVVKAAPKKTATKTK